MSKIYNKKKVFKNLTGDKKTCLHGLLPTSEQVRRCQAHARGLKYSNLLTGSIVVVQPVSVTRHRRL